MAIRALLHRATPLLEIGDVELQEHALLGERHQRLGDHLMALDQIVELLLACEVGGQVVAARLGRQRVGARVELAQAGEQRGAGRDAQGRQTAGLVNPVAERTVLLTKPYQCFDNAQQPVIRR